MAANKSPLGVARDVDTSDFNVECIDLLGNKVDGDIGVAFLIACYSILRKASPVAGLLVCAGPGLSRCAPLGLENPSMTRLKCVSSKSFPFQHEAIYFPMSVYNRLCRSNSTRASL